MAIKKKKYRLDPFNVAYGVGAAIVITGAMFKFLNFDFAYELLFVGLTVEAIVFFISAFERAKDEEESYKWERIFPQLVQDGPTAIESFEEMADKAKLDPMIFNKLSNSIEALEHNVSKMSDASSVANLNDHIHRMKVVSENFELEVTKLNRNISEMSSYYQRMLHAMENRTTNS